MSTPTQVDVASNATLADVDEAFVCTLDEYARQDFVSLLRRHALGDLKAAMQEDYEENVAPGLLAEKGDPNGRDIETAMQARLSYRIYSAIRYNTQEMVWLSVQPAVERALPEMISAASALRAQNPAGGELLLDPTLAIPRYVTAQDVHLVPGCFHSEYGEDDLAQGVVLAQGSKVFSGSVTGQDKPGGVGQSIAHWLKKKDPSFQPRRIMDIGTQGGKNLLPFADVFPDAEAFGVDVSAPSLRYGHAKAEAAGKRIRFQQKNAEALDFEDDTFDLIVSSFFFHELPVPASRRVLAECRRLLAPGGIMVHMELPPANRCDGWENFYWDWDTKYNNEPSYAAWRAQNPLDLCVEVGFAADTTFAHLIPNFATVGPQAFDRFMRGEAAAPEHGSGGWFVFGAEG